MLPFYYETTVLALDDDTQFLESLTYRYKNKLRITTCDSPSRALDLVHDDLQSPTWRTFTGNRVHPDSSLEDPGLRLELADMLSIADDPARHRQITVVVADYAMPEMSGIDFCRNLSGLPLKRILLTGKAGLNTAIEAFNEGAIDAFLQKSDEDIGEKLVCDVRRLQRQCFREASGLLLQLGNEPEFAFLKDKNFSNLFDEILHERKIVEYYFVPSRSEFVFIDGTGSRERLLVRGEDAMRAQIEIAASMFTPAPLGALLNSRTAIADFPTASGFYDPEYANSWEDHMLPAKSINDRWFWAIKSSRTR